MFKKRNWFWVAAYDRNSHDSIDYHQPAMRCHEQGWWAPDTDIYELEDAMVIIVDIAGVNRDEVKILLEGRLLSISGSRRPPSIPGKKSVHRLEIDFGNFIKRFRIPSDFDENGIEARYENGFLQLRLPRRGSRSVPVEEH